MTEIRDLLLGGADGDPALVSARRTITFGELRGRLDRTVGALHTIGGRVEKEVIFCFLQNSIELSLVYLGAISAGQAVALFPPDTPVHRKRLLVATYRPGTVFQRPGDPDSYLRESGYRAVGSAVTGGPGATWVAPEPAGGVAADLALLLSTSGSTGSPKLVRIGADAVLANATGIGSALGLSAAQRAVTSVPLCYSYGLSILTSHLAAGSAVVVTDLSPLSVDFWRLVHRAAVTTVGGTPLVHETVLGGRADRLPPSVRVLTQAGGRLPHRLLRAAVDWAARTGGAFHCMYGQTEATSRITCLAADRLADKPGSVGTPLPGGRVTVRPTRPGQAEGPIRYTGPNVMLGYATCRDDLARGREVDTLDTGDLGRLDDEGFLYVTGRSSRFAKVLDRRVSLDDVEEWCGPVGQVAAVATAGGAPIVVFTTRDPDTLEPARREIAGTLGVPVAMVVVRRLAAMPRTAAGKLDYSALDQMVDAGSG
ncbi:AMP-binding protein [Micromonospora rifamycinica]|uniref:AMP-binding protein n=1 Tax=Micromonospora rifamycinica TaxID=291594 RepID=UPI002E2CAA4E|nr:AMP-binding protein [Micromonospora rifamycinica]